MESTVRICEAAEQFMSRSGSLWDSKEGDKMGAGPRWEKGQAVLHIEDRERSSVTNAYGSLQYTRQEKKEIRSEGKTEYQSGYSKEKNRQGFVIEAREAPGTRLHTEQEKHLSMETVKKVRYGDERFLYASGLPFRDQSFFYDTSEKKKSREFLDCIKLMLEEKGHTTLGDAFSFLEQKPDRLEKQRLEKERLRKPTPEEFDIMNKRIDDLNSRLRKKEAQERQLCSRLQLMIDRGRFDINAAETADRQERGKKIKPDDWKQKGHSLEPKQGAEAEENEDHEDEEEERRQPVSEKTVD